MQVIEVERHRRVTRKEEGFTIGTHYCTTCLASKVELIAPKVRQYSTVENSLHHKLGVIFEEDASRMRKGHVTTNFSLVKKSAMNYLSPSKSKTGLKK